jgi:hypothetical protein
VNDDYITFTELFALLAIYVGPFVLLGALAQLRILRRTPLRPWLVRLLVAVCAVLAFPLTFALLWRVPTIRFLEFRFGFGGHLILPALVSVTLLTLVIGGYAWVRIRNAGRLTRA